MTVFGRFPPKAPFTDKDGRLTPDAVRWLNEMFVRNGGASAPANNELDASVSTVNVTLSSHVADRDDPHDTTKDQVGLGNADNTADADKPVSTLQQAALDLKANTADLGTMSTQDADAVAITGGDILLGSGMLGYWLGSGGTVTQTTSKSTAVTLDKLCGEVTMDAAALAAGATVSFTLNSSSVWSRDVVILNHIATGTIGNYAVQGRCISGAVVIYVTNRTAGSLSDALVLRYSVIKGAVT